MEGSPGSDRGCPFAPRHGLPKPSQLMVDKLFTVPIKAWERWWGDVTPLIGPVLQWLKGLRNRGLPHLPQLHQLSLGLNRSRIHLRPGQSHPRTPDDGGACRGAARSPCQLA
jgi:hypothetical protein